MSIKDLKDLQLIIEELIEDSESINSALDPDLRDYYEGREDAYYEILSLLDRALVTTKAKGK